MPARLTPALRSALDLLRCPGGRLVVVRPTGAHLAELRERVPGAVAVDPAKEQRLDRAVRPFFAEELTERVEYAVPLGREGALDLVGMTPSARHVDPAALARDDVLPDRVTVSVLASAYRPA